MPLTRRDKLLFGIDTSETSGLEIGALCWPVVSGNNADIRHADHLSTTELQSKYAADPQVTVENIVLVDYVCKGISLREAVGKESCFDYVVASHVVEHIPDVIGWLDDIWALLKPGGKLCLAVPDQRFTFDFKREPTGIAVLIEDHLLRRQAPSPRAVFDHVAYHADVATNASTYTLPEALGLARDALHHYHDVHCLVATPTSFLDLLESLFALDLAHYRVSAFFDTSSGQSEFFVQLEKIDTLPAERAQRQKESLECCHRLLNPNPDTLEIAHAAVLDNRSRSIKHPLGLLGAWIKGRKKG